MQEVQLSFTCLSGCDVCVSWPKLKRDATAISLKMPIVLEGAHVLSPYPERCLGKWAAQTSECRCFL